VLVTLSQRGSDIPYIAGASPLELDECQTLLTVDCAFRPQISIDDRILQSSWRAKERIAVAQIDLTNQVGFHRISIHSGSESLTLDFRTSTAKATWAEVRCMAEVCSRSYLGFRRQFVYAASDGSPRKVVIPAVQFGWFRERMPEIAKLIASIAEKPAMEPRNVVRPSTRARGLSGSATVRLLRERPSLLEGHIDGPLDVEGVTYWPNLVACRQLDNFPARVEHESLASFVRHLVQDLVDLSPEIDAIDQPSVRNNLNELRRLQNLPLLAKARGRAPPKPPYMATHIQRCDRRYGRIRQLALEYFSEIGPVERSNDTIRANLKDVWEIYQTFVAHIIGNSLGLAYTSPRMDLRDRNNDGTSMRSASLALFFDQHPPKNLLRSWRDDSERPARERPDITLINLVSKKTLILDAKFRTDRDGIRAAGDDIFEIQAYLNSFGSTQGGVLYPGSEPKARWINSETYKIVELPIRGSLVSSLGGIGGVHEYVATAISHLL